MIWSAKRGLIVMTLVCAAAWISVAQDGVDEDSLLALEEMTLTDAVEGDLPVSDDGGDDDLLAELLAGAEEMPADDAADDTLSLDAMVLDEAEMDAFGEALEEVPADDLAAAIDGIEPADDALEMPEIGDDLTDLTEAMDLGEPAAEAAAEEPFDLEAAVEELGLPSGDPEISVSVAPPAEEPLLTEDDVSLDDLLGDMAGEEATAESVPTVDELPIPDLVEEAAVEAMPVEELAIEAMPVEEKGLDALFDAEETAMDVLPEMVEEPTDVLPEMVEEPAEAVADLDLPVEEPAMEDTDLDALISELADEPEPTLDMGDMIEEIPEAVAVPVPALVETTPVVEPVAPPAMVEIVEEPEVEAYVDEMALDDDLFGSLVNEARSDLAAGQSALAEDEGQERAVPAPLPEPEVDIVEMLVDEAETDMGIIPEVLPEPPTVEPAPAPVAEPIPAVEPLPVELTELEPEVDVAPEPERPVGKSASVAAFETAERLKRVAGEAHAIESIQSAEKDLAGKNYLRAINLFEEALDYLPRRADLASTRSRARQGLGGAYYLRALSLERMGELEQAKAAALNSVKYGYGRAEGAVKRIQNTIDAPPPPEPVAAKDRWDTPEYLSTEKELAEWLKRGRQAYLTGEYEEAILAFESVLARDPENKEAIRLMNSAAQKQYDRSSMELDATRKRMMATVRDTWNPRQYGLHEAPIDEKITTTTTTSENEQRTLIVEKMSKIRIPEVDFRQANIRDVVDFLHQQSVEFDPSETPDERKGVNIILKLDEDGSGGAAPAEPLDPFAAPDDAFGGGGGAAAGDETLVTFSALDITLKEALDIVVDVAGLKYRIRGSVIIILPKNAAEGEIEHRMYDVLSTAITRLQELSSAVTSERRDSGGDFLALEGSGGAGGEEVDLKAFFTEMGVEWPDNSSIKFVRGLGKLVVANTLENLTVFEKVLSILNVVPYQIEIEARFVEVAQTDVDSLGLEWLLDDNWEVLEKKSSAGLPLGAKERIVVNANAGTEGFTKGNRFLDVAGVGGAAIADDLLSLSAVLTNPELSVVLHALQQRGHTDLLSAPKITTQSGQQATIKVVTEYIYPTEFETEGISGGNNNNAVGNTSSQGGVVGAVVTPSSFETREVGVILEVMPEVSPEGQMINLTLSPEVVSEPTWKNYGSSYTSYDPNGNPVTQELMMEQPFFHTRSLRTNLLIYNGATVVMGGMITEIRRDVDDKIPLLGDIPLLGRLFRSRYESSEKRNLLIFVTARLVDPSGRALDRSRFGVDKSIAEKIVAGGEGGGE